MNSSSVIAWSPSPRFRVIAAGPAEPCATYERCWADGPGGQQCVVVIDRDDPLGLCEHHRSQLKDWDQPMLGARSSDVA